MIIFWRFHKYTYNKIKHLTVFKAQTFQIYICCNVNTHIFLSDIFLSKSFLYRRRTCCFQTVWYKVIILIYIRILFSLPMILKLRWFYYIKWKWFWDFLTPLKRISKVIKEIAQVIYTQISSIRQNYNLI